MPSKMQDAVIFVTKEYEISKRTGRRITIAFSKFVVMYCPSTRQEIEFKRGS